MPRRSATARLSRQRARAERGSPQSQASVPRRRSVAGNQATACRVQRSAFAHARRPKRRASRRGARLHRSALAKQSSANAFRGSADHSPRKFLVSISASDVAMTSAASLTLPCRRRTWVGVPPAPAWKRNDEMRPDKSHTADRYSAGPTSSGPTVTARRPSPFSPQTVRWGSPACRPVHSRSPANSPSAEKSARPSPPNTEG